MTGMMRAAAAAALVVALAPLAGRASDAPAKRNAALIYWQAFALMPQLDKSQTQLVADHDKAQLGKDVDQLLASCTTSLNLLHRAVAHRACDWETPVDEDGMYTLLPHVDRGFRLSRLALLRARKRFEAGDARGGMADALAAMTLGRHLGNDRLPISFLVQQRLDRSAVELLARHLPGLGSKDRGELTKRLAALPAGCTLKQALEMEKRPTSTWLLARLEAVRKDAPGEWKARAHELLAATDHFDKSDRPGKVKAMLDGLGDGGLAKLIGHVKELAKAHDALIALAGQRPAEASQSLKALFGSKAVKENPLTELLMPGPKYAVFWERDAEGKARLAMLKAAIAVQGGKAEGLKSHADPYGTGPFAHKATPGGFELTSALTIDGKAVSLRVGK